MIPVTDKPRIFIREPSISQKNRPQHIPPPKCNPYPRKLKLEIQNENARGARFIHNNQTIKPCLK